jgi:hypothetical protein
MWHPVWREDGFVSYAWPFIKCTFRTCTDLRTQAKVMLRPTVKSASLFWCQAPICGLRPDFYFCQTVAGLLMWGALSDERMGLPFTIAAGPRQRYHSWVRVPRDSWSYFTVSGSRLPQPREPGPCIYIPQEHGGPVIPPGTGFPFPDLRRTELRWLLYPLRTNHPRKTQLFNCCVRVCLGSHVIATQPDHWHAGCCLAKVSARTT